MSNRAFLLNPTILIAERHVRLNLNKPPALHKQHHPHQRLYLLQ